MNETRLRWGIIGPGIIARVFANGLAHSRTGTLVAIGARTPRPEHAEQFPGARVHAGYAALLADPEVEAVYIATPHPQHAEWAIKAAEAHDKEGILDAGSAINETCDACHAKYQRQ